MGGDGREEHTNIPTLVTPIAEGPSAPSIRAPISNLDSSSPAVLVKTEAINPPSSSTISSWPLALTMPRYLDRPPELPDSRSSSASACRHEPSEKGEQYIHRFVFGTTNLIGFRIQSRLLVGPVEQ